MIRNRNDAAEKKMTRKMLPFTTETGSGGREGRRCQMEVTGIFGYGRLWRSAMGKRANC